MTQENSRPCDPDDVVCQEEKLKRLETLGEIAQDDEFLERYPYLEGMKDQIAEDVEEQKRILQKAVDDCAHEEEPKSEPDVIHVQPKAVFGKSENEQ